MDRWISVNACDGTDNLCVRVPPFYNLPSHLSISYDAREAILLRYLHNDYVAVSPCLHISEQLSHVIDSSTSACSCSMCLVHESHASACQDPVPFSDLSSSEVHSKSDVTADGFSELCSSGDALFSETDKSEHDTEILSCTGSFDLFSPQSPGNNSSNGSDTTLVDYIELYLENNNFSEPPFISNTHVENFR